MKVNVRGIDIELLPTGGMYLPSRRALVMSDLHFGKVTHFRRAGLPVPPTASKRTAEKLIDDVNALKPETVCFLGDLFHSHYNDDWETVGQIIAHFPATEFKLIRGNHDIMTTRQYERKNIQVTESWSVGPLLLTHEPLDDLVIDQRTLNVAGHLHPGAMLEGKGRQHITIPCFWLTRNRMVLPAYGSFTGMHRILPAQEDRVFLIVQNAVMEAGSLQNPVVQ